MAHNFPSAFLLFTRYLWLPFFIFLIVPVCVFLLSYSFEWVVFSRRIRRFHWREWWAVVVSQESRASFAVATVINCFFIIWCIYIVTHPLTLRPNLVLFALNYFMDDLTGCLSHGDTNETVISRKNCSGPSRDLPTYPPPPTLVPDFSIAPSFQNEVLTVGDYMFDRTFWALLRLGLLFLLFTYHIIMTSLVAFLQDSDFGVCGFSAGFAENVICGLVFNLLYCFCCCQEFEKGENSVSVKTSPVNI